MKTNQNFIIFHSVRKPKHSTLVKRGKCLIPELPTVKSRSIEELKVIINGFNTFWYV